MNATLCERMAMKLKPDRWPSYSVQSAAAPGANGLGPFARLSQHRCFDSRVLTNSDGSEIRRRNFMDITSDRHDYAGS